MHRILLRIGYESYLLTSLPDAYAVMEAMKSARIVNETYGVKGREIAVTANRIPGISLELLPDNVPVIEVVEPAKEGAQ